MPFLIWLDSLNLKWVSNMLNVFSLRGEGDRSRNRPDGWRRVRCPRFIALGVVGRRFGLQFSQADDQVGEEERPPEGCPG